MYQTPPRRIELLETRIAPAAVVLSSEGLHEGAATISDAGDTILFSDIEGGRGYKITGGDVVPMLNSSLTEIGDLNGDGHTDLILFARNADANGVGSGAHYVIFGRSVTHGDIDVSALDGSNGFKISGADEGIGSGGVATAAGDLNGDGFDDLVIGVYSARTNGFRSGSAFVIFGKPDGYTPEMHLSSLNGENGFRINGAASEDMLGYITDAAGDVNGDGVGDLLLTAPEASPNGQARAGATYILYGRDTAYPAVLELSALTTSQGFTISGIAAGDRSGVSAAGVGDLNDDGFDDIIIGAPDVKAGGVRTGAAYVLYGGSEEFPLDVSLSTLNGTTGFEIVGNPETGSLGDTTAAAGDVNGDGVPDVIIGAAYSAPRGLPYAGAAYVLFGNPEGFGAQFEIASLDGANGFALLGETTINLTGASVSAVDFNGDGYSDLIVGAPMAGLNGWTSGAAYLIFGRDTFPAIMEPSDLNGVTGITFVGDLEGSQAGFPVGGISDINGDGFGDLIIANTSSPNSAGERTNYVIYGSGTEIRISDGSVSENGATMDFVISLSRSNTIPVRVDFRTSDGTALGGEDYEALGLTTVTFAPGETSKIISVPLLQDDMDEDDEVFSVELVSSSGAVIADGVGTGTILDDDAPPSVQIADSEVLEGHEGSGVIRFIVSLAAPSGKPLSVAYSTVDGAATAGLDYVALLPGVLTFAPDETSKTIEVEVLGDRIAELSETFSVILSEPVNVMLGGKDTAVGTILNDDLEVTKKRSVTFTDVDGETVTITVNRGELSTENFSVVPAGAGYQLVLVDFQGNSSFAGADLTIKVKPGKGGVGGDRQVHVGYVNATGIDLGKVTIQGDLGQIDAGSGLDAKAAIKKLTAKSMGAFGLSTQLPGGSLQSEIDGKLQSLKLSDGMLNAAVAVSQDIGKIAIKGDVKESAISSGGKIGGVTIKGDLIGTQENPASISATGILQPKNTSAATAIGKIEIRGSVERALIAAGVDGSGAAINGAAGIGNLKVGGDWSASSVVAGVVAGNDGIFGTPDDRPVSEDDAIASRIASILVKGSLDGSTVEGESFGFLARQIGKFKASGEKVKLVPGAGNDLEPIRFGEAENLILREVS